MPTRGRKPSKRAEGEKNWVDIARDKHGVDHPTPEIVDLGRNRPECPEWICETGREHWDSFLDKLDTLGVYSSPDFHSLCALVHTFGRWIELELEIAEEGDLVAGSMGQNVLNPLCRIAKEYHNQYLRWAAAFGLTPADRRSAATVADAKGKGNSKMEAYM